MMKWLTIIFLLTNVGYFGWQINEKVEHPVPVKVRDAVSLASDIPLLLLSELEELPPLREEFVVTDVEEEELVIDARADSQPFDSEGGACLAVGPYQTIEAMQEFKSWLLSNNSPHRERLEEIRTRERYWVYLEPQSVVAAKAQMEELKNKGLKDYYMISKGDMKNAISLGLFSSQDSVNRRLQQLKKQGYNPVVVPQHKVSRVFWLDAQINNDLTLPNMLDSINILNIDCFDIALLETDH